MSFRRSGWHRGISFVALPGSVVGYGDRGVNGVAYRGAGGYVFRDKVGGRWWIIFQPHADEIAGNARARGDVLACSHAFGEAVQVRVLAGDVLRCEADAAFGGGTPSSYEDAAGMAAAISDDTV